MEIKNKAPTPMQALAQIADGSGLSKADMQDLAAWSYNTHHATITDMAKEVAILRIKASGTLANNLCPDHRDKQVGKPCLACEIEKMAKRLEAAERDAARYRWLRRQMFVKRNAAVPDRYGLDGLLLAEGIDELDDSRYIDQAIDAAMQESGEWTEGVG